MLDCNHGWRDARAEFVYMVNKAEILGLNVFIHGIIIGITAGMPMANAVQYICLKRM